MLVSSSLDNELLHFIQSKRLDTLDISLQEDYILYSKMIIDILYYVYHSFHNIEYSMACCELSHSIFIITLKHTLNTKLAMFLCDRARTLFIEYINISYEMGSKKNINLIDIKIYIYSKTIGPLQISKYTIDMNINPIKKDEQSKISKMNDLFILYKQFIYNIYTYLINNIDKYKIILDDDDDDYDDDSSQDDINNYNISKLSIQNEDKYKNDHICTTLEMIRVALDTKIFKSYLVFNILYLEEILNIDFNTYTNIYIPINKLSIQLQIIIDGKIKQNSSKNIYNKIKSFTKNDYIHHSITFISTEHIQKLDLYKNIINSFQ